MLCSTPEVGFARRSSRMAMGALGLTACLFFSLLSPPHSSSAEPARRRTDAARAKAARSDKARSQAARTDAVRPKAVRTDKGRADPALSRAAPSNTLRANAARADEFWHEGVELQKRDRYKPAISCFTKALRLRPDHPWAAYDRGCTYQLMGEDSKALSDFALAIKADPKNSWAYVNTAQVLEKQHHHDQAIDNYCKAASFEQKFNVRFDKILADAYLDHGDFNKCLEVYAKMLVRAKPDKRWQCYEERAQVYLRLADYKHAISDFTQALAQKPEEGNAYLGRAKAYLKLGDRKHALTDYSKIIALTPDDEAIYKLRADVYLQSGQYQKAVSDYSKSIELSPEFAWRAYKGRAQAYEKLGRKDLAARDNARAGEQWGN